MSTELQPVQPEMTVVANETIYPIVVNVVTQSEVTVHIMDPNSLLVLIEKGLSKLMQPGTHNNPAAKQLAGLMKIAVKGVLLMYGNKILELLLGKDHPKPGKQDDLIEWWTHMLAKIGIGLAMKHMVTMTGKRDGNIVKIVEIGTQPNPNIPSE